MTEITYLEAIRQGLIEEMERDPNVFLLGEDIAFFGGSKAALRRQAQLIERHIFRRFIDPSLDVVFRLEASTF